MSLVIEDKPTELELAELLDNVTAALESCLAHYGESMPIGDHVAREGLVRESREVLSTLKGGA